MSSTKYEIATVDQKIDLTQYTEDEIKKFNSITTGLTVGNNSVLEFGSELQKKLGEYSDDFLNNVKAFDAGEIGTSINDLLTHINYANPETQPKGFKGLLLKIPGVKYLVKNTDQYLTKYDSVSKNIDDITNKMDVSRLDIIKDNVKLDILLNKNFEFIDELEDYIISGHIKKEELNEKLKVLEEAEGDVDDITIGDKKDFISRLSKRIHDMELTRVITVQSLPQIKMVQNNNITMAEKIQVSINSTIPVWKNQIALAVTMKRQKDISMLQEKIYETTNNILTSNAKTLKSNSIEIAKQNERGFISTDSIKEVNDNLISTLNEINKIKDDGQKIRDNVQKELKSLETKLKESINK